VGAQTLPILHSPVRTDISDVFNFATACTYLKVNKKSYIDSYLEMD